MDKTRNQMLLLAVVVVGAAALAVFAENQVSKAPAQTASSTITVSTSTPGATVAVPTVPAATPAQGAVATGPFPINPADRIASWTFKGAYSGNATLTSQANADITHLTGLLGKGQYDDYDLYDGIANDYTSLGDGQTAYDNYNRAIAIHPSKGLAYANLGHLFDGLGAEFTAADAYAKATVVEPTQMEYYIQRLDFLTGKLPNDNSAILAAFSDASKQFGDAAPILSIEAEWLAGQKRYADAIAAWQKVESLSPGADNSSIDAQIARLKAKE
ncbi:MAG: hypothetical protein WAN50_03220 [Minisyncoccia bacterium]